MAMVLDMRPAKQSRQRIKGEIGMKRTLTILSAALFAGALMVPAVQAQEPPAAGAPAAGAPAAEAPAPEAPAAEATPMAKKHHKWHHHKKKSTSGETGASGATGATGETGATGATGATWRDGCDWRPGCSCCSPVWRQQLTAVRSRTRDAVLSGLAMAARGRGAPKRHFLQARDAKWRSRAFY